MPEISIFCPYCGGNLKEKFNIQIIDNQETIICPFCKANTILSDYDPELVKKMTKKIREKKKSEEVIQNKPTSFFTIETTDSPKELKESKPIEIKESINKDKTLKTQIESKKSKKDSASNRSQKNTETPQQKPEFFSVGDSKKKPISIPPPSAETPQQKPEFFSVGDSKKKPISIPPPPAETPQQKPEFFKVGDTNKKTISMPPSSESTQQKSSFFKVGDTEKKSTPTTLSQESLQQKSDFFKVGNSNKKTTSIPPSPESLQQRSNFFKVGENKKSTTPISPSPEPPQQKSEVIVAKTTEEPLDLKLDSAIETKSSSSFYTYGKVQKEISTPKTKFKKQPEPIIYEKVEKESKIVEEQVYDVEKSSDSDYFTESAEFLICSKKYTNVTNYKGYDILSALKFTDIEIMLDDFDEYLQRSKNIRDERFRYAAKDIISGISKGNHGFLIEGSIDEGLNDFIQVFLNFFTKGGYRSILSKDEIIRIENLFGYDFVNLSSKIHAVIPSSLEHSTFAVIDESFKINPEIYKSKLISELIENLRIFQLDQKTYWRAPEDWALFFVNNPYINPDFISDKDFQNKLVKVRIPLYTPEEIEIILENELIETKENVKKFKSLIKALVSVRKQISNIQWEKQIPSNMKFLSVKDLRHIVKIVVLEVNKEIFSTIDFLNIVLSLTEFNSIYVSNEFKMDYAKLVYNCIENIKF